MSSDLLFGLFGLLAGLWFGSGMGPAILVWMRNPGESMVWKVMASAMTVIEGPCVMAKIMKQLKTGIDMKSEQA